MTFSYQDVAKMIDHSLLNPTLTVADLEAGCRIARDYDVASACIMPHYLARCAELLAGSTVKASTTIGFPHGGHTTAIKVLEAERALKDGGEELDMVINISRALSGDWAYVSDDIRAVVDVTHARPQGQSDLRERLLERRSEDPTLCDLCRGGSRLGQDLHRIRTDGRDR